MGHELRSAKDRRPTIIHRGRGRLAIRHDRGYPGRHDDHVHPVANVFVQFQHRRRTERHVVRRRTRSSRGSIDTNWRTEQPIGLLPLLEIIGRGGRWTIVALLAVARLVAAIVLYQR